MSTEAVVALVTGQGSALVVLLLWIRAITKDRDFWRELVIGDRTIARAAIGALEQRPPPAGGLQMVRDG